MNVNLSLIEQIRALRIKIQPPAESETEQDRVTQGGGGLVAQQFTDSLTKMAAGYHVEHNTDDSHKTINATGSIAEHGRSIAQGVWIPAPYVAGNFTANTGTWQVLGPSVVTLAYMLVGMTMWISWDINVSQLAFSTATTLLIRLPSNATATRMQFGTFSYNDNGTRGTGSCQVTPSNNGGQYLRLLKDLNGSATWSVSTNLSVAGTMACEVRGVDS